MMPSPENDLSKYTFHRSSDEEIRGILTRIDEYRALRYGPYLFLSDSEVAAALKARRRRERQAAQAYLGLSEQAVAQGTPAAATTTPEAAQVVEASSDIRVETVSPAPDDHIQPAPNLQGGLLVQEPS